MQRFLQLIWMVLASFTLFGTAQAEGFGVGVALGFPTFLKPG